jgi:hypothetical protein
MTKKTANKNTTSFHSFINRVDTIVEERKQWQTTLFTDSNNALYDMLSGIYELYEFTRGNPKLATEVAEYLYKQCEAKQLKLTKKPTHIQLLVKYVFADAGVDSRRVSAYVRVLTAAALSTDVTTAAHVPDFIRKAGGVEEVRAAQAANTTPPSVRAAEGRKLADKRKSVATVSVAEIKQNATSVKNSYVALVGKVNASGDVEVKYVCYEQNLSKTKLACATAIKSALSNLFSNKQRAQKANSATVSSETNARTTTRNIVGSSSATTSHNTKVAEAA